MAAIVRRLLIIVAACYGLWPGIGTANAEERIAVIISSTTPVFKLNAATLRHIYLKKIFLDGNGHTLIPVNLPPDHPLRLAFARAAIHMSDAQLGTYWNRRYFQGVSPPYVLGSQNAVVQFVAETPGAIGYVAECYLDARVRPLLLLPMPAGAGGDPGQCPQQHPQGG